MTSMWKQGSQRLRQRAAIVATCRSFDQPMPGLPRRETSLNCADSPP
ncbi:hypothetical protein [Saccharothrix luteola]|nr:hypothetical protein [Saccharothrix luteola]MCC8250823.1 hypothetical protein [Saccharothrix luteola]